MTELNNLAPVPVRQIHAEWPDWAIAFVEYSDHTVAVAVRYREEPSRQTECLCLEEAVAYAQALIAMTIFVKKMRKEME
jgi:hypothetical protein